MQNMFKGWQKLCFWWLKTLFWSFGLKTHVFEKHLNSFHVFHSWNYLGWIVFCIIFCSFSKKFKFLEFRSIKCVFRPIENPLIFNHYSRPNLIGIQSMLDWSKLKNFQFLSFWPNFFHASFMFRIYMHYIISCIHLAVLQSYLSLFSHITCIHFAKLGTQLDLKIDWLIFESFVHFSICYFLCVNYRKYFSSEIWWIINVQIFSLLIQLFMGHIVSNLHLLKEIIFFFMCILNLVFKFGLFVFIFPTS